MDTLLQDIRYAAHQLRKSLAFTSVAVLTLSLGIAVNATMFSLVSAFLLSRPPAADPARVVVVSSVNPGDAFLPDASPVSVPNYLSWRDANNVFSDMAAAEESRTANIAPEGRPESVNSAFVSTNYFDLLGVSPQLGRGFAPGEDQPGRDRVVILSHDLWKRHFNSDPAILRRAIRLNREDYTVIGVMPEGFRLLGFVPQLWTPLVFTPADRAPAARNDRPLRVFARLKPRATLQDARVALIALAASAQREFPSTEKGWSASVRTLQDFLIYNGSIRSGLLILMTTVGFVLMIACANVAGLLLARAVGRQKEIGLRISLGATRLRIIRQLLAEGLLISSAGGAAGLLFAFWGIQLLRANLTFNEVVRAVPVTLDRNVLLFTLGVSFLSTVLSSLVPALKASRTDVNSSLNGESRGSSAGRSHSRLRSVLVIGEIAVALFLLIGSGLLIQRIFLVEHQDLGFRTDHLLTARIALDGSRYQDAPRQTAFLREALYRLRQRAGVDLAAAVSDLPATGTGSVTLRIKGQQDVPADQRPSAVDFVVTPDYFRAAGIPLLRGRSFTDADSASAPPVVLVNQEFVRRHFPNQDAIGQQVLLDVATASSAGSAAAELASSPATPLQWRQIIGVVADIKSHSETPRIDPQVYESFLQRPVPVFSFLLRTSSDPDSLAPALRDALSQVDSELPVVEVVTMTALVEQQRNGNPFFSRVLGAFAVMALILAAIGIYGLIAYSVGLRTREIGVRMALGAHSQDVLRMVLREGLKMTAIGAAVGVAIALPLPKVFDSMFYDFHTGAPWLYVLVPVSVFIVTACATYVPARRASKVDPMVALRFE